MTLLSRLFAAHVDHFCYRRDIVEGYLDEVLTTGVITPKHGDTDGHGMIYHAAKAEWVQPKHKDIDSRGRMFHKKHGWIAGDATAGAPIIQGKKLSQPAKKAEPEAVAAPKLPHDKDDLKDSRSRSSAVAKMLFHPIGPHGGMASDREVRKLLSQYDISKEDYDRHHAAGLKGTHGDEALNYEDHIQHLIKTKKIKTKNPYYAGSASTAYRAGRSMAAYRKAHTAIPNIKNDADLENHVKDLTKNLRMHGVGNEGVEHAVRAFTNSHAEHHLHKKINSARGAAIDLPNGNKAVLTRYKRGKITVRHPSGNYDEMDLDDLDTAQKTKLTAGDVTPPESLLKAGAVTLGKPGEHPGVAGKGTHSAYHTILPTTHSVDGEHGYHVHLERNGKHVDDLLKKLNKSAAKHDAGSNWEYDHEKDTLTLHDKFGHHKFHYDDKDDHNWYHATSHARGSLGSQNNPKYDIQGGAASMNKAHARGKGTADIEPEDRIAAHHADKSSLNNLKHRIIPVMKNTWREITKNSWRAARVKDGELEDTPVRITPKKGPGYGFHLPLIQKITHTPPSSRHDPKWEEYAAAQAVDPRTDRIEKDKNGRIKKVHVVKRNYNIHKREEDKGDDE